MTALPRRSFLKAMAAAPTLAKNAAAEIAAKLAGQEAMALASVGAGFTTGGALAGNAPMAMTGAMAMVSHEDRIYGLWKMGMLPDWLKQQCVDQARWNARSLDPDIVSLRSVSLSAKMRMQMDRNIKREHTNFERDYFLNKARNAFYSEGRNGVDSKPW